MKAWHFSASAPSLWKTIALFLCLAFAGIIAASAIEAPASPTNKKPVTRAKIVKAKPYWNDLTPSQRLALAPLATDWNKLDSFRKEKWLELANRYASMSPADQLRMQERMRDWVKLSPEQRWEARQSYTRVKKLDPKQKSAQWEQYQQLPEEKKKELAATVTPKRTIANPPLTHGRKTAAVKKPLPKPLTQPPQEISSTAEAATQTQRPEPSPPAEPDSL